MVENLTLVFIGSAVAHLKHGAACEPTCHSTRDTVTLSTVLSFKCPCCPLNTISTAREYFEHIGRHLKKQETMCCVFENCPFRTNIYGTFASDRSQKHTPHTIDYFNPELLKRGQSCEGAVSEDAEDNDCKNVQSFRDSKPVLFYVVSLLTYFMMATFLCTVKISVNTQSCIYEWDADWCMNKQLDHKTGISMCNLFWLRYISSLTRKKLR